MMSRQGEKANALAHFQVDYMEQLYRWQHVLWCMLYLLPELHPAALAAVESG